MSLCDLIADFFLSLKIFYRIIVAQYVNSVEGHLDWVLSLVIVNKAVINIHFQVFVWA